MRREISNPSDKATIDCSDREAACLAVLILGQGKYGIIDDEGDQGMPIFVFGGVEEWIEDTFGKSIEQFQESVSHARLAAALESVQLEGVRSSMNDFTGRAHQYAAQLREAQQA
ncbi:hypothetical protein [Microbulbifer sp. JSM ZJ756]|uniref:hypothetical protein n=1 Tax=Microbulbifer sp. JSM ZJ756 TaxID=3376191 RepID=UPI0037929461